MLTANLFSQNHRVVEVKNCLLSRPPILLRAGSPTGCPGLTSLVLSISKDGCLSEQPVPVINFHQRKKKNAKEEFLVLQFLAISSCHFSEYH